MKNRMINTKFWTDTYISNIDPLEKLLFLYFITNPFTNICGIYELPLKQIALDTGIDRENLEKVFLPRFKKAKKIYYINGWVYIKNFLKHQKASGNVQLGIENGLKDVPSQIMAKIKQLEDTGVTQGGHSLKLEPELEPELEEACVSFKSHTGKNIELQTADNYQPDGFSPLQARQAKKAMERALGKNKTNKWSQLLFGSAWDFIKAYQNFQGQDYVGNVITSEWAKTLAGWYEKGETRETLREMLIDFFGSEKAEKITITPNSVFSAHTYNSWKQGKLKKREKLSDEQILFNKIVKGGVV